MEEGVPVYNYVSSVQNRLTWFSFKDMTAKWGFAMPSNRAFWLYSLTVTRSRAMYLLLVALLHFLPALLVDAICFAIGNPFRSVKPGRTATAAATTRLNCKAWDWSMVPRGSNIAGVRCGYSRQLLISDHSFFFFVSSKTDLDEFLP